MTRDEFEAVVWRVLAPVRPPAQVVDQILEAADEYLATAGWDMLGPDPKAAEHRETLEQALAFRRKHH